MERRLGKGLGSLIGGVSEDEATPTHIPTDSLHPNPFQPRRVFAAEDLESLAASLRQHGMLQPIVVRKVSGRYEIISGERRWRASRQAGMERVPVVVRVGVDDRKMLELALVENLQRKDLNPIERALGFRSMAEKLGLTQEQVAERVGLQRSSVANHIRLLELPEQVQDALSRDLIQMGHARALLALSGASERTAMMELVARDGLSVRQVEERVRQSAAPRQRAAVPAKQEGPTRPAWAADLERRLVEALGTKVTIRMAEGERSTVKIGRASCRERVS
jgi:ParB family chromosome partitioning protein